MKRTILFFIVTFLCAISCFGEPKADTDSTRKADSLARAKTDSSTRVKADSLARTKADSLALAKADSLARAKADSSRVASKGCDCIYKEVTGFWDWVLIFTPIMIFLALSIILGGKLSGFDFQGALSENEIPKYTIVNPEYSIEPYRRLANLGSPPTPEYSDAPATEGIGALLKNTYVPPNLDEIVPPTLEVSIVPGTNAPAMQNYRPSISRYIAFFSGMLTVIIAVCMASFFIYQYMRTNCPPDLSALSTVLIALGIGVAPYAFNKVSTAIANRKTEE